MIMKRNSITRARPGSRKPATVQERLKQETVGRLAAEKSLQHCQKHSATMLAQSRQMQEQMRHLSHQILLAQEDERKRISRELHDDIAQTLAGITVYLATLKKEAALNTKGLDRTILRTQRLVEKSVNIVHRFARELRPAVLDNLGLTPALNSFAKTFSTRTRIAVRLRIFENVEQMGGEQRTMLYRVAQEAFTNVARHAHATRIDLTIFALPGGIGMTIQDNGKSFQVQRVLLGKASKHLGLLGMRERVEMVAGTFCIESTAATGTLVKVTVPFVKSAAKKSALNSTLECR